jgi:hypothetical protein
MLRRCDERQRRVSRGKKDRKALSPFIAGMTVLQVNDLEFCTGGEQAKKVAGPKSAESEVEISASIGSDSEQGRHLGVIENKKILDHPGRGSKN